MCNEENLSKYPDLPDDCILLPQFKLAGIIVKLI